MRLLQFYWYKPVLYKDTDPKFPHTKELSGHFVGIAKNTGDALTFQILCKDGKTIIDRSVVCSALDAKHRNQRVKFEEDIEEKLNSLETINPFVIPANRVKTEESDNSNDLAMTDADVEQAGRVASITHSRTRMAFAVNAIEPEKTK